MTIHSDHPFAPSDADKQALRRLRGRLPAPVSVIATGAGRERVGLTVSSIALIDGPQPAAVAFVDPDSDLADALVIGAQATVSILQPGDEFLAEAFAGLAPAPGGPFTLGSWLDSPWGPRLAERSWCGVTVAAATEVGWSLQITADVETIELRETTGLAHARGRFHPLR